MTMITLTEFLEARIAEDEAAARAAAPWATGSRHEGQPMDWSIHFDRWSPTRVLAECAAKRKIVRYTEGLRLDRARDAETDAQYRSAWWIAWQLATVYKDHPDYRREWEL